MRYTVLTLSSINITCLLNFFLSLLPLFSGATRIWKKGVKAGIWGAEPPAANRFFDFHIKSTHLSTLFIEKGRTVPVAVSAVSNRQYKNILVGLPKNLGMCIV